MAKTRTPGARRSPARTQRGLRESGIPARPERHRSAISSGGHGRERRCADRELPARPGRRSLRSIGSGTARGSRFRLCAYQHAHGRSAVIHQRPIRSQLVTVRAHGDFPLVGPIAPLCEAVQSAEIEHIVRSLNHRCHRTRHLTNAGMACGGRGCRSTTWFALTGIVRFWTDGTHHCHDKV